MTWAVAIALAVVPRNGASEVGAFPVERHDAIGVVDDIELPGCVLEGLPLGIRNVACGNGDRAAESSRLIWPPEPNQSRTGLRDDNRDGAKCCIANESTP